MNDEVSALYYGGTGETFLHPFVLVVTIIACTLIFFMERRRIIIPILFLGLFIPMSQKIVIAGLDLMMMRILILIALIRLFLDAKLQLIKLNSIDKVLILWVVSNIVGFTLLWKTSGAFINRIGFAYNALGIYFICRCLILDFKDIDRVIKTLVVISCIFAVCMIIEQVNGRNAFYIFGGVPEFTPLRAGRLRSQGSFAHPIMAGTFGAVLLPMFMFLWWQKMCNKKLIILGLISASIITLTSSSSGPLIAYLAAIIGLCMWPFRHNMRKIRWGILISLVSLHLIMKAPVWALVDRVGIFVGSSSYHRYRVLDQFINRVNEWWLFGTKSTSHWGWMMWDNQNQYVSEGTTSGLISLVLFIIIFIRCFRAIGVKIKAVVSDTTIQLRLWVFGAALFTHMIAFMGAVYFDQIIIVWYALLAMISVISSMSDTDINAQLQLA